MRKLTLFVSILALLLVAVTPSFAQEEPGTIADIVVASTTGETPEFTILLAAVQAADPSVLALLSQPDAGVTVFAPTDAAFAAAFEALGVTPEDVLADPAALTTILAYHVVPLALTAENVVALDGAYAGTFVTDAPLMFSVVDGSVMVNDATVVMPDVIASNGIVHAIDSVLLPPAADEAMGEMEATAEPGMEMAEMGTVGEVAMAAAAGDPAEFTTLVAAVTAADPIFVTALTGDQPLTVFAPTDAAFAAAFEALAMAPEDVLANVDLLNSVLAYHVLPGEFTAAGLVELAGMSEEGAWIATAIPGVALTVTTDGTAVMVDDANVVTADVYGSNGVIHVIDAVLLPPQ